MKMKFIGITSVLMFTAGWALAQENSHLWSEPHAWWGEHLSYDSSGDKYTANEFSLDLFGSYQAPEKKFTHLFQTDIRHTGTWGGGVGANYFFSRQIGVGADINIPNNGREFVDQAVGSVIARVPIGNSGFAPYAFGGGGRGFDPVGEWLGHAGVGAEFRFNRVTGVFLDGRYVWADKTQDRLLLRSGIRLVF